MATRLQRLRREGLSETFPFAGPAFRRAAPWLLAAIAFAGLLTRIHPTIRFGVWGSDSGEYILLTRQLVDTGRVLFPYDGWGLAYPYFPGMFVVSGAVHAVLGVDLQHAVLWTTPLLASTIPVLVGLLAYRVTSDPRVGALAGAFVAVTAPVVLVTSHAMPGTLGHVFLLALLAFLPDAYRDRTHGILLAVVAVALVLTHHLSTYFAAGILAFIPFYREITQRSSNATRLRVEIPLAGGLVLLAAIWWLGVAVPFREQIVGDALKLNPWITAVGFLGALALLPLLVVFKRQRTDWHRNPRYPSFPRQRSSILGTFFGFVAIILAIMAFRVPGTNMEVGWPTFFYVLPVLAFVSFLSLGVSAIRFHKHGTLVLGWLYAILGSLAFASATNSRVLFPFRHVDYMVEAMAPLVAVGMVMVYDQTLASRIPAERARTRANLVAALAVLLVVSAVMSIPPREAIGGFEEGMTNQELAAVRWVRDHPEVVAPNSTMAADHRVSSLLWGLAGIHATWDYTPRTYHAEDAREVFAELSNLTIPAGENRRIDHVFLSPEIERGVTLLQWENSRPMSPQAIAKFEDPELFEKLYDEDGVRIYRVRWENSPLPEPAPAVQRSA